MTCACRRVRTWRGCVRACACERVRACMRVRALMHENVHVSAFTCAHVCANVGLVAFSFSHRSCRNVRSVFSFSSAACASESSCGESTAMPAVRHVTAAQESGWSTHATSEHPIRYLGMSCGTSTMRVSSAGCVHLILPFKLLMLLCYGRVVLGEPLRRALDVLQQLLLFQEIQLKLPDPLCAADSRYFAVLCVLERGLPACLRAVHCMPHW
jgi:hypothetical protein